MSTWAIFSLVGGLLGVLIIVLLAVIFRAVSRTAENAVALVEALEDVRSKTASLADLEAHASAAAQAVDDATAVLVDLRQLENERDGRDPDPR